MADIQVLVSAVASLDCVSVLYQLESQDIQVWCSWNIYAQTFLTLNLQEFYRNIDLQSESFFHGVVIQDSPSDAQWYWHQKPLPQQSPCTLGVAYNKKVWYTAYLHIPRWNKEFSLCNVWIFHTKIQELGHVFTHVRRHQIFVLHREDNGTNTKAMEKYVFSRMVKFADAKNLLWLYSV